MNLILLHGAVGIWDEVACLAIPSTVILAVVLAVVRQQQQQAGIAAPAGTADNGAEQPPLPEQVQHEE